MKLKRKLTTGVIGSALLACLESRREKASFITTTYKINSPKLDGMKQDLKIVVLSDLHDHMYGAGGVRLLQAIATENPDLILLAGDMITSGKHLRHDRTEAFLKKLTEQCPVFYGMGNHESKAAKSSQQGNGSFDFGLFLAHLQNAGVRILHNDSYSIKMYDQTFCINGLTLPKKVYKRGWHREAFTIDEMTECLGKPDPSLFHILLAHTPTEKETYSAWGADLTVSGHLHGGVLLLPGGTGFVTPQVNFFYPYAKGCFAEGTHTLVVSAGLGTHKMPFRIMNRPEMLAITLSGTKGN